MFRNRNFRLLKPEFFFSKEHKHAQKENVEEHEDNTNEKVEEKNPVLTFDDTKESPVIYGKDLQIPAFIRRQHD